MTSGPSNRSPRVTAVVLNWCDAPATGKCLESLRRSDYPDLGVLLVDNGSPDGSGDELHRAFPWADYLQTGSNLGYTGGNNRGIARALDGGADFVLVLNPDAVVESDTVSLLVDTALQDQEIGAVAPTVLHMDDPERVWYGGGRFDPIRGLGVHWNGNLSHRGGNGPRDVTFFTGCSVLLRREAIEAVGAFAEEYFLYVEDAELSVRMAGAGWRIVYQPAARVHHRTPPPGTKPPPDHIRYRDRNRRRLARTHLGPLARLAFGAWFYPTRALLLARYLAGGDVARARAILRGLGER